MKFLVFSDFHHEPGVFHGTGIEGIRLMQKRAEEEGCDFIIQLGDLCHGAEFVADFVKEYNDFHIPSYHALGNHDAEFTSFEDTLKYYNMPAEYYYFDNGGYRIIVMNPNYYYEDGEYTRFSLANWLQHNAARDHIPPEQLAWLEKTIADSPYPCVIMSHQSFERVDGVKNRQAVLDIINAANQRKKHSVLMCINGHYHRDNIRILDGVCYFDVNSASIDWIDKKHHCYPDEMHEQIRKLGHLVVFEKPLYAIVTLEGTTIDIKGSSSEMLCGVTYKDAAGTEGYDRCGRKFTQYIQSANITLG